MKNAISKNQTTIIKGSLADIAKQNNTSIAESFISADAIVLVDTSGSMSQDDAAGGKSRYDVACSELAKLQETLPGKIAVISFSTHTMFCPNGQPYNFQGGTDLGGALRFAKVADVDDMRFVVISDGEPQSPSDALKAARTYKNRIDVIYVGSEFSNEGRAFLNDLARSSDGVAISSEAMAGLAQKTQLLLAA